MKKTITYGQIKEGRLHIFKRSQLDEIIKNTVDCYIVITFEKKRKKRSIMQNSYYFGVIINDFCNGYYEMTGEKIEPEQAHEILKLKCNYKEVVNQKTGEVLQVPGTTTELSTTGFEEYLEDCRKFIYEWFGITILLPNEQAELF